MKLFARKVSSFDLYASQSWYVPGLKGMFGLLLWFLAGALLGMLVQALFLVFVPLDVWMSYGMILVYPLQFLPAMIYVSAKSRMNSLFEKGYKLNSSNFGKNKWWEAALATVLLSAGTIMSADLPNYLNYKVTMAIPGMEQLYNLFSETMRNMTQGPIWSSFLVTAIFAPVFEEWLCRGMVLRGLLTRMKPSWAIIVSALFFALIHFNPWQALNAFIIGVVMGYVYYKTGSLALTMLIHFVNNGLAVVLSNIPSLAQYDFWIDMMGRTTYGIVYLLGLCALAGGIIFFRNIPLKGEHGNMDEV